MNYALCRELEQFRITGLRVTGAQQIFESVNHLLNFIRPRLKMTAKVHYMGADKNKCFFH